MKTRFALIGSEGHYQYYEPSLHELAELELVAVAPADERDPMGGLLSAPGVDGSTHQFRSYEQLLDAEKPDVVQVCAPLSRLPAIVGACVERRIAVISEKPLAMDLATLSALYRKAKSNAVPIAALYGYRRFKSFEAVRDAVAAGEIGQVIGGESSLSYRWGKNRPDSFRSRSTFPGIVAFIGVHIVDWLLWICGDLFVEASGSETCTAHPDYPACASLASFMLGMKQGGTIVATVDYLRPASAATHGDARLRIFGTLGVAEANDIEDSASLVSDPAGQRTLSLPSTASWYTQFIRSIRNEGASFITTARAFRVSEIALKIQQAIDERRTCSLAPTEFLDG